MSRSLKDQNSLGLYALMAANLVVFYSFVQGDALVGGSLAELLRGVGKAVPAGLGLALTAIVNAQLSAQAKSRVVFLRWRDPLPGCRAFTHLAVSDPRVDVHALERVVGPLPTEPREQDALWYRLYKTVEDEPAVVQVHRAYLFARDSTCLSLMILAVLGTAGAIQIGEFPEKAAYVVMLALQFGLSGQAARNNGHRFVTTVLAIKASRGS